MQTYRCRAHPAVRQPVLKPLSGVVVNLALLSPTVAAVPVLPPFSPPAPRFVEQEVDRVKQLFERKESRLRSERDEAAQQAEAAAAATAHLEAKVGWQHKNAEHQTCLMLFVGDQLATAPWQCEWDQEAERWLTVTERNCQPHPIRRRCHPTLISHCLVSYAGPRPPHLFVTSQVLELQAQLDDTARELQQQRRDAEGAAQEASSALQRASAASQEASRQRARVAEVEGEMRELLAAVEAQKAANAAKMRQLATLLHDM